MHTAPKETLRQAADILDAPATEPEGPSANGCCAPTEHETCCEPDAKADCCGPEQTSGGGCGCR